MLISHRHGDHTDAIDKLVEATGAPVRSAGSGFLRGLSGELVDGEVIDAAGLRITVWATPVTPLIRCPSFSTTRC